MTTGPQTVRLDLPRYDQREVPGARRPVWQALTGNARPGHWAARHRATKRVIADVVWAARNQRLHQLDDVAQVEVTLTWAPGDRRRADADNLWPLLKVCCDALARGRTDLPGLHLVPDDTPTWMTKHAPVIAPPPATGLWLDLVIHHDPLDKALVDAGYHADALPLPGTVWEDRNVSWLPAGHRRLVKVTSAGPTINGWQVRVVADNDVPPGAEPVFTGEHRGLIFADHLIAWYRLVGAVPG